MSKPNTALGEKIYNFPFLYKLKIDLLNKINSLDINFNKIIKGKKVLDIGCGSYQTRYDVNLPSIRIGIDPSKNSIKAANKLYPKSKHIVGKAESLPFKKNEFDVSLLLYVLHHTPFKKWPIILNEAKRVTKDKLIIFDHIKSENPIFAAIQMLYWKSVDGGDYYARPDEWKKLLEKYDIKTYKRVGKLFSHICYYEISLKKEK